MLQLGVGKLVYVIKIEIEVAKKKTKAGMSNLNKKNQLLRGLRYAHFLQSATCK